MNRKERKRLLQYSKKTMPMSEKPVATTNQSKIPLMNSTEEIFQFIRIHYQLLNKDELGKTFTKLKCMEYDAGQKRWVWLFQAEAKKINFNKSYHKLPKHLQPIVLGSFFMPTDERAYFDVNSIERMSKAILFFDKKIGRTILPLLQVQVVNKLLDATIMKNLGPNNYLNPNKYLDPNNPGELFIDTGHAKIIKDPTLSREAKQTLLLEYIKKKMREPMKEIEIHPTNLYENGNIQGLIAAMKMSQRVAYEHFNGNENYTMLDCMQEIDIS